MSSLWFDESQLPCLCNYGMKCDCDDEEIAVNGLGHFVMREDDYDPRYDEDEPFRDFWDAGIPRPGM